MAGETEMTASLTYPRTNYETAPLADLSELETRKRLSPTAIRMFFRIMDKWNIRNEDARALLGSGISNGVFFELKKSSDGRVLEEDALTRISYLVGIYKALNILHGKKLADEWVQLPNQNRIFRGKTPLEFIMRGGLPAFQTVRRLLDARRGGQ